MPENTTTTGLVVVDGGPVTGDVELDASKTYRFKRDTSVPVAQQVRRHVDHDWFAVELDASTTYRFKVLGDTSVPQDQQVLDTYFTHLRLFR